MICVGIMVEDMLQRKLIQQSFTQFGVGIELSAQQLDARWNRYIPEVPSV